MVILWTGSSTRHSLGTWRLGHLEAREFGDVLLDRIVEPESAFLVEGRQGYAGDGLGHRVDAKDRVLRHGSSRCNVLFALGLEVRDLALPGAQGDDAGEFAVVHPRPHGGAEFAETRGAHSDGCRFGGVEVSVVGLGDEGERKCAGEKLFDDDWPSSIHEYPLLQIVEGPCEFVLGHCAIIPLDSLSTSNDDT